LDKRTLALAALAIVAVIVLWPSRDNQRDDGGKPDTASAPAHPELSARPQWAPWYPPHGKAPQPPPPGNNAGPGGYSGPGQSGSPFRPDQQAQAPGYGGAPRSGGIQGYGGGQRYDNAPGYGSGQSYGNAPGYGGGQSYGNAPGYGGGQGYGRSQGPQAGTPYGYGYGYVPQQPQYRFRPEDGKGEARKRFSGGYAPPRTQQPRTPAYSGNQPSPYNYPGQGWDNPGYDPGQQPWPSPDGRTGPAPAWQQSPDYSPTPGQPWETPAYSPPQSQPWDVPSYGYPPEDTQGQDNALYSVR
jgi:hypothetical protein